MGLLQKTWDIGVEYNAVTWHTQLYKSKSPPQKSEKEKRLHSMNKIFLQIKKMFYIYPEEKNLFFEEKSSFYNCYLKQSKYQLNTFRISLFYLKTDKKFFKMWL